MTITTHATLGAVIGALSGSILIAFLAGFMSHFLVDTIPHGDSNLFEGYLTKTAQKKAYAFITLDAITAILVLAIIFGTSTSSINSILAAGIIGSVLPDLLVGIHEAFKFKILKKFSDIHLKFHNSITSKYGDITLGHALLGQLVFIIVAQRFL